MIGDFMAGLMNFFGHPKENYEQAKRNFARDEAAMAGVDEVHTALATLAGPGAAEIGTELTTGRPLLVVVWLLGHILINGASGSGKTKALELLIEPFLRRKSSIVTITDPKGETAENFGWWVAGRYHSLPEAEREEFASQIFIHDLTPTHVTPMNLFRVPDGMPADLLASLRASAMRTVLEHELSRIGEYAFNIIFSVLIAIDGCLTMGFVHRFLLNDAFRLQTILPKLTDPHLREIVEHLDTALPLATRNAIVRQFQILFTSPAARVAFGMSARIVRELSPNTRSARIRIGNFAPSQQRTPELARLMAVNDVIETVTESKLRPGTVPQLNIIEEFGDLSSARAVSDYVLHASRVLRSKGVQLVAIAQDGANAIPKDVATALVLNSKTLIGFESGKEEALWFWPHVTRAARGSEAEQRRAFVHEMAKLPSRHAILVQKGLPAMRFRTRDVPDPRRLASGTKLQETLTAIARRSMVSIAAATERIAAWETATFEGDIPQQERPRAASPDVRSIDEIFDLLDRARQKGDMS